MYPFAILEETIYGKRKSSICILSSAPIHYGDTVYAYKPNNYDDTPFEYALKIAADKDAVFLENKSHFLNRTYPIEAFISENIFISLPKSLLPFYNHFEKGLDFLQNPLKYALPSEYFYSYQQPGKPTIAEAYNCVKRHPPPNIPYDVVLDEALMKVLQDEKAPEIFCGMESHFSSRLRIKEAGIKNIDHNLRPQHAIKLVAYWLFTPYHKLLVSNWQTFSDEFKIVLSFSDISFFAEQVEKQMKIPQWRMLLSHLFSQKFTFENFNYVLQWTIANKEHIPLLAKAVYLYDLHCFSNSPNRDFNHYSYKDNATRLIYLFITMPEYEPVLKKLIDEGVYPGDKHGERYVMECHYYRAAIAHYVLKKEYPKAEALMERMTMVVKRHFSGSPKSFINETLRWAKQMMRETLK